MNVMGRERFFYQEDVGPIVFNYNDVRTSWNGGLMLGR
jgi:hypothetical protein